MPASFMAANQEAAIHVVSETDDIVAVCLEGEFDMRNAHMLDDEVELALTSKKDVILDLSQATFIDSSVIHALFRVSRAVNGSGRTAVLQLGTAPIVERALEFADIERVLPRARSRSEAIRIIRRGPATE